MVGPRRDKKRRTENPLAGEVGTIRRHAPVRVALGYPATYKVASSSLGFQTMYRLLNQNKNVLCERFFMPSDSSPSRQVLTAESGFPVSHSQCVAFSVACETDLLGVASLLDRAGLHPLAANRDKDDPLVVIGGPITLVDPRLPAGMADAVVAGDGEEAALALGEILSDCSSKRSLLESLSKQGSGIWVPSTQSIPPSTAHAPEVMLPAFAATWSPEAELKNLFLVEVGRGCNRTCSFCVMSGKAGSNCGFRPVGTEQILEVIPKNAPGVGLVGAAVTDHPSIEELVEAIVARDQRASLSSVRADRLTPRLISVLVKGGLKTLTVAADGSSERLRRSLHKGIRTEHLERAAKLAVDNGLKRLKVYSMVGVPGEEDRDIDEFADLLLGFGGRLHLSTAVQAFIPKPTTPLAGTPMENIAVIRGRLDRLKRRLKGKVRVLPTSPKWSWVDWKIANSGMAASTIAYLAYREGGGFSALKKAIEEVLGK